MCNTFARTSALACLFFTLVPGLTPFSTARSQNVPTLDWMAHYGSSGPENANGVLVDPAGNTYVIGGFSGNIDFDPGPGNTTLGSGYSSTFITKLDEDRNFQWVKAFYGSMVVGGYDMAVDAAGNLYFVGSYSGTVDLDPGQGTFTLPDSGGLSGYVCKLSTDGDLSWGKGIYGSGNAVPRSIAVHDDAVYVTGYFTQAMDFDPGPGTDNLFSAGLEDAFVLKWDTGGVHQWAYGFGDAEDDKGNSVHVDPSGALYCAGSYRQQPDMDPGPGTHLLNYYGTQDIYMMALDSSGSFLWANGIGSTGMEFASFTDWTNDGNLLMAGYHTQAVDFDPDTGLVELQSSGGSSGFVASYGTGGELVWVRQFASAEFATAYTALEDGAGRIHVVGSFFGEMDADPGSAQNTLTSAEPTQHDGYYVLLDSGLNLSWSANTGGMDNDQFYHAAMGDSGAISILASFTHAMDFDLGSGMAGLNCLGISDIALLRMVTALPVEVMEPVPAALAIVSNPVTDGRLKVDLRELEAEPYRLRMVDALGNVVVDDAVQGGRMVELDVDQLPAGMFQVEVAGGRERMARKVIILR
jgi:hypothetical protein